MDNPCPRIERNRRWRARREDSAGEKKEGNDDEDEEDGEEKDEKEKRKRKNKEWRERRSTSNSQVCSVKLVLKMSSFSLSDIFLMNDIRGVTLFHFVFRILCFTI